MSQNDFTIANQSFPAFRADLNSALQALASNNSGTSAPSTTFANMWWYDSTNNIMYIRNEDNDAWIKFAELDQTNDKFVLSGTLQLDDGTVSAPALTFNSDTNMGIYRGGTDILKFVTAGTDAITIDASQNVGIGTSSPDDAFHVNGNVFIEGSSPEITFETTGASNNNWQIAVQENVANALEISVGSQDADASNDTFSPVAVFTSSGNVGIGTTSPNSYSGYTALTLDNATNGGIIDIERNGTLVGEIFTDDINTFTLQAIGSKSVNFRTNGLERMRIDSSGNLLVGKTSTGLSVTGTQITSDGRAMFTRDGNQAADFARKTSDGDIVKFHKDSTLVGSIGNAGARLFINSGNVGLNFAGDGSNQILPSNAGVNRDAAIILGTTNVRFRSLFLSEQVSISNGTTNGFIQSGGDLFQYGTSNAKDLVFYSNNTERMRITSSGTLLVGQTAENTNVVGCGIFSDGFAFHTRSGAQVLSINRQSNDGTLISFRQDNGEEGTISVSGTTISYNGGHLSRWSQLADNTRDNTIVKGTVMTNLDQMAEWTTDGVTEDNEQLNCMAVSSVEGDANVAGVFVNWDNDDDVYTNDMNIAMTGDMVIRIAQGTTVARGDLLMSAGDGTAKPQGDDIVRSKTIAKVTSTNVSHTYDDGTYLVPCVLMAC